MIVYSLPKFFFVSHPFGTLLVFINIRIIPVTTVFGMLMCGYNRGRGSPRSGHMNMGCVLIESRVKIES